ncbi:MAG TPA: glycerol-3-phosphate dehydrogenase [Stellaceae bacterium]|nr:glycerol-3-phosphate dehydrogenase [Stellaceae bacterium]
MAIPSSVDLLIVGGGINGAGIARDAAGRGLRVMLVEKGDLAGATSSASSKLIHGGLRYLEFGEFRLVREALVEREVLLAVAPHLIHPLEFVLPHDQSLRPRWMLRLGLLLYDHLGRRKRLPASRGIDPRRDPMGAPLRSDITAGFVYADCWDDDARLVVENARGAARAGTTVLTRTELLQARREGEAWQARIRLADGTETAVAARALVNAGGPWAMQVAGRVGAAHGNAALRLVKGSHVVVPRLYEGDHAFILQNDDRRIVFVLPFEEDFTLIGTTEEAFEGDPAGVACSDAEAAYLCRAVSRWFRASVRPEAILWRYAGVRPLYEDHAASASAVTRDYVLILDAPAGSAPLLSVLGGKITTYRRLAETALDRLRPCFPTMPGGWTDRAPLPGGDLVGGDVGPATEALRRAYPWLEPVQARRLTRRYGSEAPAMLDGARQAADLGIDLGAGLTAAEVGWLRREEWAWSAEDILWRRTKLGLRFGPAQKERLAAYLAGL